MMEANGRRQPYAHAVPNTRATRIHTASPMPYAVATENGVNLHEGPSTYHESLLAWNPARA